MCTVHLMHGTHVPYSIHTCSTCVPCIKCINIKCTLAVECLCVCAVIEYINAQLLYNIRERELIIIISLHVILGVWYVHTEAAAAAAGVSEFNLHSALQIFHSRSKLFSSTIALRVRMKTSLIIFKSLRQ